MMCTLNLTYKLTIALQLCFFFHGSIFSPPPAWPETVEGVRGK